MRTFIILALVIGSFNRHLCAQQILLTQDFDTSAVPALPQGWISTTGRLATGDFATTSSSPHSPPNAVLSTNATVSQSLISPPIDFSAHRADSLVFYERRSATHTSGLLLEASTDGGISFPVVIGETLRNAGTTAYVRRALGLPRLLDGQPGIRIRWRVVGDGSGTTGTIRFDDIALSARAQFDAEIAFVGSLPEFPSAGDSALLLATVKNAGSDPLSAGEVEFYEDSNSDSLPGPDERFASLTFGRTLMPGDTLRRSAEVINLAGGAHAFIVRVRVSSDEDTTNDLGRFVLLVGTARQSLVVNEIMYAPLSGPEWIELSNTTAGAIDLAGWKLSNRNTSTLYTIPGSAATAPPNAFVVVTKDSIQFRESYPASGPDILQVSSLPTFLFNNTGDAVVLFDAHGVVIDSARYSPAWGGGGGKSLERIEPLGSSTDSTNWGSSGDGEGSTPGRRNYLTPLQHNLRAVRIFPSGTPNAYAVLVQNIGRESADGFSVSLFCDADHDSAAAADELIQTANPGLTLAPADSAAVILTWETPPSGEALLIGVVGDPRDERPRDDTVMTSLNIPFPSQTLIINEIMYEPASGGAEYVELLNRSGAPREMRGWRISDAGGAAGQASAHLLSASSFIIGEGEYLVLASDSGVFPEFPYLRNPAYRVIVKRGLFSLNNSGDDIILSDPSGAAVDSVHYLPSWHNPDVENVEGKSLERISPEVASDDRRNWSTCARASGGTPGEINSLYTVNVAGNASLTFSPNPFSPDGDGFEDVTLIRYELSSATSVIRLRIYDASGRLVRTLADGDPGGAHGTIIWDGYDGRRERVAMGIYIVLLEALDGRGGEVQRVKGVVVVAARM